MKVTGWTAVLLISLLMPGMGQELDEPSKPEAQEEKKLTRVETPALFGWKEWVWIAKPEMVMHAKLDTGARTCSIHATNIEPLEVDGKKWVKFTISEPCDEDGMRYRLKTPVVRVAKVKNDRGGLDERYVVMLVLHIGGREMEAEFTLNDRSTMNCAVLIGRNLLTELGAVDSSRMFTLAKPKLPAQKRKKKPVRITGDK